MTKQEAINKLVLTAKTEVGYHEGSNNYNKYADDPNITKLYGWNPQNQPWCCTFANWCFLKTFGYDVGSKLTFGGTAACSNSAQLFKNAGSYVYFPQIGDQAFYSSGGGINHTGIVVKVEGSEFTAVEGNYSDKVSLVKHNVGHSDVAGFGRPDWNLVINETTETNPAVSAPEPKEEDHRWKPALLTMSNSYKDDCVILQAILNKRHFPCGSADGFFGAKTQAAVRKFQAWAFPNDKAEQDGIVGKKTWNKLLEVEK